MISTRLITALVGQGAPVLVVSLASPGTIAAQATLTGRGVAVTVPDVLSSLMREIWQACSDLLAAAFVLLDGTSTATISLSAGPLAAVWSTSLRASVCLALGVFCWQLLTGLRGRGKGEIGVVVLRYGLGFALSAGAVSSLLSGADSFARFVLQRGLPAASFQAAFAHLVRGAMAGSGAITLGLVGLYGLLPAALGYAMVVIARQVTILLMIATAPVIAVGLMTRCATRWFWLALRWMLTAIGIKPVLALVLTLGFTPLAHAQGAIAVLGVVAILWVGLGSVWTLYALLRNLIPATESRESDRRLTTGSTPPAAGVRNVNPSFAAHSPSSVVAPDGSGVGASLPAASLWGDGPAVGDAARAHPGVQGLPAEGGWPAVSAQLLPSGRSVSSSGARRAWLPTRVALPRAFFDRVPPRPVLDTGLEDSGMTALSRVRCHDGPPFRGRGRVCLMHDSIETRWAATAQITHPAVDIVLAVHSAALLAHHVATLWQPRQPCVIDRLSLLVRARSGDARHHGRVEPASRNQNITVIETGEPDPTPEAAGLSGVRYEVFVTVSGPETALAPAARAAGGGLTGRALALYRQLDVIDIAATSLHVGSLMWLSSPNLAQVVCAGLMPADRAGVPGVALADTDSAHAPVTAGSSSAYHHGRSATVAYRVGTAPGEPTTALAALLDLATDVQAGEQRCLALHYDTAPAPLDPRRDAPAARLRQSFVRPIAAVSPRLDFPGSCREQTDPHGRNLTHTMIGEDPATRWHAGVACTVAAPASLEQHTARLEHDVAERFALLREADQQAAFVAACLPLGIALDEASTA